jgi:hypothetical protein
MALARIITRSHPCSRQLALDLLGRGYAVEIVSPDSIPDNLADLELRVEEDPGNQLVASVEAHNGERTASLEFLHYLKAPMPDFIRRPPPEPHEAVHFPELPPVSFKAEQSAEDVELAADAPQLASTAVSQTAKILGDSKLGSELDPKPDSDEGARLILPPDPLPSPVEPPGYDAVGASTMAKPTMAKAIIAKAAIAKARVAKAMTARTKLAKPTLARIVREWERRDRSAGWSSWRIALTVVGALLLVLVLGYGMRRTSKASAQSSGPATTKKVAEASTDMNLLNGMGPKKDVEKNPASPPAIKSVDNSSHTPKESQVAKTAAATAGSGAMVPRRHGDDLIARDTVTYLNRKQDGVIAANTVTLDDKPAPKAVKQDSGIKRYSDLK